MWSWWSLHRCMCTTERKHSFCCALLLVQNSEEIKTNTHTNEEQRHFRTMCVCAVQFAMCTAQLQREKPKERKNGNEHRSQPTSTQNMMTRWTRACLLHHHHIKTFVVCLSLWLLKYIFLRKCHWLTQKWVSVIDGEERGRERETEIKADGLVYAARRKR